MRDFAEAMGLATTITRAIVNVSVRHRAAAVAAGDA
jgi:hypothetical protein